LLKQQSESDSFSSLKIVVFLVISLSLWNQLIVSFRQPCINHSPDDVTHSISSSTCSPLSYVLHHAFTISFQAQNSHFPIFSTSQ